MISINGTSLSDLGFTARGRGAFSMGGARHTVLPIPGGIPVHAGTVIQPGRLRVTGTMAATDHATLLEQRDQLIQLLQGDQVIWLTDFDDREWVGKLDEASSLELLDPQWIQRAGAVTLEWVLADPRARRRADLTLAGSGALLLGTAPSEVRVTLTASTAIVRVRAGGASGAILTELTWTGSSGSIVIDAEARTITRNGANAIDGMSASSTFPIADPAAGADYLEIPNGGVSRITTYRRRWW